MRETRLLHSQQRYPDTVRARVAKGSNSTRLGTR